MWPLLLTTSRPLAMSVEKRAAFASAAFPRAGYSRRMWFCKEDVNKITCEALSRLQALCIMRLRVLLFLQASTRSWTAAVLKLLPYLAMGSKQ